MNRRHYLLTVALSLAAGVAGHALYAAFAAPPAARAAAEPQRELQWEYCALVKSQSPSPRLVFWIAYFKGEGVRTESVEATLSGNSQAKAIAKLGEDGWEMIGEGPLSTNPDPRPGAPTPTALFFKRRKD